MSTKRSASKKAKGAPESILSSATPIYVQLIMHFRHQIESGKWRVGETIPTLDELAKSFGVTRATVRQAVGFLQREGLLNSRRGRGTTVVATPRRSLWQELPNSWDELVRASTRHCPLTMNRRNSVDSWT